MRFDVARIERELAVVVGKPLWAVARAADMLACQFGAVLHRVREYGPKKGQPATSGELALHVQCPWRLTGPEGIVLGSGDHGYPHSSLLREGWLWWEDPAFDHLKPGASRWDEFMLPWQERGPYNVERVTADTCGGLRIALAGGFAFDVVPDHSNDSECWRFFRHGDTSRHFVVTGRGIED